MKAVKFTKVKNSKYKVLFEDGREELFYEDVILKYNLLIHKIIDDKIYKEMTEENQKFDGYYTALRYVNTKLRSVFEVHKKLKDKGFTDEVIEEAIRILEKQGYLNDKTYAESFVKDDMLLTSNGPFKIRRRLQEKGVEPRYIEAALELYKADLENEKAHKMISKMIKSNHNKSNSFLRRKIINHLIDQGYHKEIIEEQLQTFELQSDEAILKQEYDKLYKKLSKKYQDKELEQQIRKRLYQKGFKL